MINISYSLSHSLNEQLNEIERQRANIALFPLSRKTELLLRFEATIARIESAMQTSGREVSKKVIGATIRKQLSFKGRPSAKIVPEDPLTKRIIGYKTALDYIAKQWYVNSRTIDVRTVLRIQKFVLPEAVLPSEEQVNQVLTYLQTSSENPVIQAAIAKFALLSLFQLSIENDILSNIYSYLFLYKAGYDFRGLLVLEREFFQEKNVLTERYSEVLHKQNLISWIEYFAQAVLADLRYVYENLVKPGHLGGIEDSLKALSSLNTRQADILNILEDPALMLTNRQVQKRYRISQVTASRDLAKLSILGLLLVHGKGRSVRYSRA